MTYVYNLGAQRNLQTGGRGGAYPTVKEKEIQRGFHHFLKATEPVHGGDIHTPARPSPRAAVCSCSFLLSTPARFPPFPSRQAYCDVCWGQDSWLTVPEVARSHVII